MPALPRVGRPLKSSGVWAKIVIRFVFGSVWRRSPSGEGRPFVRRSRRRRLGSRLGAVPGGFFSLGRTGSARGPARGVGWERRRRRSHPLLASGLGSSPGGRGGVSLSGAVHFGKGNRTPSSSVRASCGTGVSFSGEASQESPYNGPRPQVRREHPLNLSLSVSGGGETNRDSPSSGERTGKCPSPNRASPGRCPGGGHASCGVREVRRTGALPGASSLIGASRRRCEACLAGVPIRSGRVPNLPRVRLLESAAGSLRW